jgi:N-hydroxyarylamine O-acetyltransferase
VIDASVQTAYLGRLGLEAEPPSVDALFQLHRRHVERVAYETMWIHGGETWDIDPGASAARVAFDGRGGYCFHLNGALSELLMALGYTVTRHVGGVHRVESPYADSMTNHLVLTVAGLPTDENPNGVWYVDAGLGHALHEPVPLLPRTFRQGPFVMSLERTDDGIGDWHLTNDPAGSFVGMSWRASRASMGEFAERHVQLSTSPESNFVRLATAQRRDATGGDVLRGLVLARVGDGTASDSVLTERDDWFAALADVFGLRFDGADCDMLDRLWERCLATHRAQEGSAQL